MTQLAIDKTDFTKLGNLSNTGSEKSIHSLFFVFLKFMRRGINPSNDIALIIPLRLLINLY